MGFNRDGGGGGVVSIQLFLRKSILIFQTLLSHQCNIHEKLLDSGWLRATKIPEVMVRRNSKSPNGF